MSVVFAVNCIERTSQRVLTEEPSDVARHTTVQVPHDGAGRTFKSALAIRRLDLFDFDVLHAHGNDGLSWRRRVPMHLRTLPGSCFDEARRIRGAKKQLCMVVLGLSEVLASLVADTTVVVSPQTRRWVPWVRTVMSNGVDTSRFTSPPSSVRESTPTILFVGTYYQRKRGALLWRLFRDEVLPALPDVRLWMLCTDAPNAPGVEVLGWLSGEDLRGRYWRATVLYLSSSYEGVCIPFVETLASGPPVIASPNQSADYVTDGGRLARVVTDDRLGAELVELLQDAAEQSWLAARGYERAAEFDLHRMVETYVQLYTRTTSGR